MKRITQEEFDNFPIDEYDFKTCPSGDYTDIKVFGGWCRFGEFCKFRKSCTFENGKIVNSKYFACDRIESENKKVYFFVDESNNIFVK